MPHTLVTFHAHPDDEAIATGGSMARAKAEGHRVVLVVATKGELGEFAPEALEAGETLTDRRVAETMAAAEILGVDRVAWLGYYDSGMAGEATNHAPGCFAAADVEEAAARLAALLDEEHTDAITIYDELGNYGHPDHVQVHRVGHRAAELANTPLVFEATMNRDHIKRMMSMMPREDIPRPEDAPTEDDVDNLGVPESELTTAVDVRDYTERKRAAMAAHASQIPADSFFLQMPAEVFREVFGWEWFIRRGAAKGIHEHSLFETLDQPQP